MYDDAAYKRERYRARRAAGLCGQCGGEQDRKTGTYCTPCFIKHQKLLKKMDKLRIRVAFTQKQRDRIDAAAKRAGVTPVAWLKRLALEALNMPSGN